MASDLQPAPTSSAPLVETASKASAKPSPPTLPAYAASFAESARRFADVDALIFDGEGPAVRTSYRDLDLMANRLAHNLAEHCGVGLGDLVATVMVNRPELVVLLLACQKLGATFVPLATDLRTEDCRTVVAMYSPKLLLCDQPQCLPFLSQDGQELRTIALPAFREGGNQLKEWMAQGDSAPVEPPPPAADQASIIFSTSGSTGLPKGVMYSSQSVAFLGMAGPEPMVPGERALMWVSMRGVASTLMLLGQLCAGTTVVMADTYPSGPVQWADLIDRHAITWHILFGAAMNQTIQEMPGRTFPSLKAVMYGGSCFAPSLVQRSMEQFPNARFSQGYGMTENILMSTLGPEFHKRAGEATAEDLERMTSAGKVHNKDDMFVEDPEQPGSGLPPPEAAGGVGQICSRSPLVMMGYWGQPEKTKEAMPDGKFVRTGDVGRITEDGFVYISGRLKEIIPAYSGFNVTPRDVEEVVYQLPAVGEVAVVGVPHPSGAGEAVVAWVSAKAGCELSGRQVRDHCEASGMPRWQIPDAIHILGQLPTTGGKVARKELQSPPFRQKALASALASAREGYDRGARGDADAVTAASAFLLEVSRDGSATCSADLRPIFGEHTAAAARALHLDGEAQGEVVTSMSWQQVVGSMPAEDRSSFLLLADSLAARR